MREIMAKLLALQSLEFGNRKIPDEAEQKRLRAAMPEMVLAHYDRLMARGKRGVAIIRQGVCTACHLKLPLGTLLTLAHGEDLQLCGNCGRYLYLPQEETPGHPVPKVETKPARPKPARGGLKRRRQSVLAAA